jgi:hypothetical protein
MTWYKIIKLKEPLSPHPKITLPFDFNFYLINLMKETILTPLCWAKPAIFDLFVLKGQCEKNN